MGLFDSITEMQKVYHAYLRAGRNAEAAAYLQGFHDGVDSLSKSLPEIEENENAA